VLGSYVDGHMIKSHSGHTFIIACRKYVTDIIIPITVAILLLFQSYVWEELLARVHNLSALNLSDITLNYHTVAMSVITDLETLFHT
jgi:hypothetical protein